MSYESRHPRVHLPFATLSPTDAPLPAAAGQAAAPPKLLLVALLALLLPAVAQIIAPPPIAAQSLLGSHESMARQNQVAQQHDYAYLRTPHDVSLAIDAGTLVPVSGNEDYELAMDEVSYPYARAEVKMFLEQLAHAYRLECGEPLVVTSLTRPITRQPWNASPISVHPTGMAVDLRRTDRRACRQWLESTLLALEAGGMIEATRELWPAHYHLAVFPDPLLLPGPIGDPGGVVRLAALHQDSARAAHEADAAASGRVRLVRGRNGRLQITQGAIARRGRAASGRMSLHRSAGATRHRRHAQHSAVAQRRTASGKHRAHAPSSTQTAR
ncbi:MAG TPA: DUF5715 family protein [Thermoanaerobaculia bacterium]|nr:DUF5715 family protein [Thermoanaerobaculia bacterium]